MAQENSLGLPSDSNITDTIKDNITTPLKEAIPPLTPIGIQTHGVNLQITPPIVRGYMNNSITNFNNINLIHSCDFRFIMPNISALLAGLPNPAAALAKAIANAKLRAAAILRKALNELIDGFRFGIKLVVDALGLDVTGYISSWISKIKKIIATVNKWKIGRAHV